MTKGRKAFNKSLAVMMERHVEDMRDHRKMMKVLYRDMMVRERFNREMERSIRELRE